MRWLIVGPYPPSVDPGAAATLAAVRTHLAAGDEVTVVSPDPSGADRTVAASGLAGFARLRRLATGFDGLHLRFGGEVGPTPSADRATAAAERAALRLLLAAFEESVIDVGTDDLHRMPGGRIGGLVLASGARFVVDSDESAAELVGRGAPAGSVSIRDEPEPTAFTASQLRWRGLDAVRGPLADSGFPPADRAAMESWVRDRAHPGTDGEADDHCGLHPADVLRGVPPLALPSPPARGGKRLVAIAAARATRWLFDPVVAHVNRLHAAAIEAAETDPDR